MTTGTQIGPDGNRYDTADIASVIENYVAPVNPGEALQALSAQGDRIVVTLDSDGAFPSIDGGGPQPLAWETEQSNVGSSFSWSADSPSFLTLLSAGAYNISCLLSATNEDEEAEDDILITTFAEVFDPGVADGDCDLFASDNSMLSPVTVPQTLAGYAGGSLQGIVYADRANSRLRVWAVASENVVFDAARGSTLQVTRII